MTPEEARAIVAANRGAIRRMSSALSKKLEALEARLPDSAHEYVLTVGLAVRALEKRGDAVVKPEGKIEEEADLSDLLPRTNTVIARVLKAEAFFRSGAPDGEKEAAIPAFEELLHEYAEIEKQVMLHQDRVQVRIADGSVIPLCTALSFVRRYRDVLDVFGGTVVSVKKVSDGVIV